MPTLYMMVGVPLSGKSTWIEQQNFDWEKTVHITSDKYTRDQQTQEGGDFTGAFHAISQNLPDMISADVTMAVSKQQDIVWDQTNVSETLRRFKLGLVPDTYRKVAVVLQVPHIDTLNARVSAMTDKNFPPELLDSMVKSFQMPTTEEGFDEIRVI